jgi:ABC-type Zn uptake system ZnuABC Zn-binding protein ZnuA
MQTRLLLASATIAVFAACTPSVGPTGERLRVLAAETFLADIAQNVAGNRLTVDSLLTPGLDPHEFQPTPQDAIRIAQADLLIVNGLGYESWLEKLLEASSGGLRVVEASAGVAAGPGDNPHLWMNPRNVIRYAENTRAALSAADPDGSSVYAANTDAYIAELRELDSWISAQVERVPPDHRIMITNHHALESFAEAYGFEIAGVVIPSSSSGAAPSAQQMAELIGIIESLEVRAIFMDVSENPGLAQQLASESQVRVITGLYVETLSEAGGPAATYLDMMEHDVGLIVDALQ